MKCFRSEFFTILLLKHCTYITKVNENENIQCHKYKKILKYLTRFKVNNQQMQLNKPFSNYCDLDS